MSGSSIFVLFPAILAGISSMVSSPVVDTGQQLCFNSLGQQVSCLGTGQDAAYDGNQPSYSSNGDGTVTDNVTHLIWQKTPDSNGDGKINIDDKMTQGEAVTYCSNLILGGASDWRLPDIKTLYSLMDFRGEDVSSDQNGATPFIDTSYFDFGYGDTDAGERLIDAQWATTTIYVDKVMVMQQAMFGLNLADGRIKGYGVGGNTGKTFYVQCVRGKEGYGKNSFEASTNVVSDMATGLMWQRHDSGYGMSWDSSISFCEGSTTDGYADWRLPNAKELQSIVDYTRSPGTTGSAALDPLFEATLMVNEAGQYDYGFYWSGTTHKKSNGIGDSGVYIAFGRALGYMKNQWMDVHGAGAQRSDPKIQMSMSNLQPGFTLAPTAQGGWAIIHGPQGDVVRSLNYVRCVRDD